MAETSKVKEYFKKCFDKKLLIQKGIIAASALAIILIFSLSFYFWLKDTPIGYVGGDNGFWNVYVTWNRGIGWSALEDNPGAIYALQSVMFILLLAIYLLVTHDRISSSFIALAMFGGLFNLIQRATSGTDAVLDYFQFGFWKDFPIFNWPDMGVVIGIFGFVITYIVQIIIEAVKENKTKQPQPKKED